MKVTNCIADEKCPMTMGYYIGGGRYICWLHALVNAPILAALQDQQLVAIEKRG